MSFLPYLPARVALPLLSLAVVACQQSSASSDKPIAIETAGAAAPSTPPANATSTAAPGPSASAATEPAKAKVEAPPEGMVKIPAGVFLMGANAALGNPEERPAHEAAVPAFFMDKYEVTVDQYKKCVAAGGCKPAHENFRFCNTKYPDRGNHPISCVDLYMAKAYCEWVGKRLPTEREWEYAASGGSERRRYSWGNAEPTKENCCYEHPFGSCEIGQFEPGAFGLYDMTGNNWEWVLSEFTPYPTRPTPDEIQPKKQYVYRGGSWSRRFSKWMRVMLRNRWTADSYSGSLGMRCVKPIEPLECPNETTNESGVCVRTSGEVICEPAYKFDGKECKPDFAAGGVAQPKSIYQNGQVTNPSGIGAPAEGADAKEVAPAVSRSRTAQHDADCQRHWPAYPHSYLFKGGENYPSRKPILRSAGCVPRDMGWSWTSACCK